MNQLQPLYQNCYTAVLALPQISIHTWGSIFPPPPLEEPEHTTLPVDEAHTIPAANSPKTPPKPRVSIVAEVNDLLTWVMADKSSLQIQTLPHREGCLQWRQLHPHPGSQRLHLSQLILLLKQVWRRQRLLLRVSPANISPITAACSSRSASPSVDPIELWTDMPTWLLTTCSVWRGPQTSRDNGWSGS